jgi:hypothetical protein
MQRGGRGRRGRRPLAATGSAAPAGVESLRSPLVARAEVEHDRLQVGHVEHRVAPTDSAPAGARPRGAAERLLRLPVIGGVVDDDVAGRAGCRRSGRRASGCACRPRPGGRGRSRSPRARLTASSASAEARPGVSAATSTST